MTTAAMHERLGGHPSLTSPAVDVVLPVHNEAHVLRARLFTLHAYLRLHAPFAWRITIVDNASTDGTLALAETLALLPGVRVLHLDEKGRGRALRAAWTVNDADVVAYMDIDLSTDLSAFVPLVSRLLSDEADVAIGSRLAPGAHVERGAKREVISRAYNGLLRLAFGTRVRDAQCGFKAVRASVAQAILPEVVDQSWFFDTELLLLAERSGLRITEVPVTWVDDPDSRVAILRTALDDLKGVWRMRRRFWRGEGIVGVPRQRDRDCVAA